MHWGLWKENGPAGCWCLLWKKRSCVCFGCCTAEEMLRPGRGRALVRQLVKCAARDPEAGRLFADVPDSSPLDPVFLLLLSEGWIPSSFQLSDYTCTLAQLAEQEFWRKNMGEAV